MTSRTDRVLVVGGGGFIGRHIVAAFRDRDAGVSVMDVAPAPDDMDDLDWTTGSITDSSLMASAADGCGTVVFLANASLPGSSHADLSGEVKAHVAATVNAAEICAELGVERFLFASSGGTVYGYDPGPGILLDEEARTRPRNAYGASKLAIEHYLRLIGTMRPMRTLSLRLSNPYGEGQRARRAQGIIAAAMQHAMDGTVIPVWGDGSVERDFIHVSDVAAAFVAGACYDGPRTVMNVGAGEAVSLNAILDMVREATGRPLEADYQKTRAIDVQRNALSIERARQEMGWAPSVGLPEGLARTARWWASERGVA